MNIALLEPLEIADDILDAFRERMDRAGHTVVAYAEKTSDPDELYQRSADADVVIIANTPYPRSVVERLTRTKLIQVAFTGLDHVATQCAEERGIEVRNAAGYSDQAVAELVVGLAIAGLRGIVSADAAVRNGGTSAGLIGREIAGKTVGIIGTGNIGLAVARIMRAFGARVVAYSRTERPEAVKMGVTYLPLTEMLGQSDIVTVHLPLNDSTRHFLSIEEFTAMRDGAYFINCARGPIVDSQALATALAQGTLSGAAIDVFDGEPPLPDDNPLLSAPHVTLTPHVAFYTHEAMERRARIVFDNVAQFLGC